MTRVGARVAKNRVVQAACTMEGAGSSHGTTIHKIQHTVRTTLPPTTTSDFTVGQALGSPPAASDHQLCSSSSHCVMADGESLSDEEMRKLLKPCPTDEDVLAMLQHYFTRRNDSSFRIVRQLDSYDDCNYQVEINEETFLLKIHNGVESKDYLNVIEATGGDYFRLGSASSVIHLQNAILWTLTLHGITTSLPVPPNEQPNSSPVAVHSVPVSSEAHSPSLLAVRLLRWVPGHPMSSMKDPIAMETLAAAGRLLGRMDAALDTLTTQPVVPVSERLLQLLPPHIVAHVQHDNASLLIPARRYHQWDGKNMKDLRGFVQYIESDIRRRMVESVIDAFVADTAGIEFRTGINQGDFNGTFELVCLQVHDSTP